MVSSVVEHCTPSACNTEPCESSDEELGEFSVEKPGELADRDSADESAHGELLSGCERLLPGTGEPEIGTSGATCVSASVAIPRSAARSQRT